MTQLENCGISAEFREKSLRSCTDDTRGILSGPDDETLSDLPPLFADISSLSLH